MFIRISKRYFFESLFVYLFLSYFRYLIYERNKNNNNTIDPGIYLQTIVIKVAKTSNKSIKLFRRI